MELRREKSHIVWYCNQQLNSSFLTDHWASASTPFQLNVWMTVLLRTDNWALVSTLFQLNVWIIVLLKKSSVCLDW
jgi:hypothetical protein